MSVTDEISVLRNGILDLLSQQMAALNSSRGLSDAVLTACYRRQERMQELRERLQSLCGSASVVAIAPQIGQVEGTTPYSQPSSGSIADWTASI